MEKERPKITEAEFAFIDAIIAGDIDEAMRIAYRDLMQGEQITMF